MTPSPQSTLQDWYITSPIDTLSQFTPPGTGSMSPLPLPQPDIVVEGGGQFGVSNRVSRILVPGMAVADVLTAAGISPDQQEAARCTKKCRLWDLYHGYERMAEILRMLGLTGSAGLTYHGGLVLRAQQVLMHFSWNDRTFGAKKTAFQKVKSLVVTHEWGALIPDMKDKDYRSWIGIVAMFEPDSGFIYKNTAPRKTSPHFAESCAAELAQNTLFHRLSAITELLQEK
ncbi:hypothetical protein K438DRAFT_1999425 [Mycena galopus ATCC 62051]|nr:hypothetical protein K438DRAFT_1999425 [Mycena galopus ATCC 62051]